MTGDEAVVAVIDALESTGIAYMLVGSLATNFYGVPRATEDADFVMKLRWAITRPGTKDRDDARDVIAIQHDRLDWRYIQSWADRHGTRALLDEIRRELSPDAAG